LIILVKAEKKMKKQASYLLQSSNLKEKVKERGQLLSNILVKDEKFLSLALLMDGKK